MKIEPPKNLVINMARGEPFDVRIDRKTRWGNPFGHLLNGTLAKFIVGSRAEAIARYEEWIKQQPELMAALPELRGKVLGCWCAPGLCHGYVLARLANAKRCRIYDTNCLNPSYCDERNACCAGDPNLVIV